MDKYKKYNKKIIITFINLLFLVSIFLFGQTSNVTAKESGAGRYALIEQATGKVINVIILDPSANNWSPPPGYIVIRSDAVGPGDIWDGKEFKPAPPPEPEPMEIGSGHIEANDIIFSNKFKITETTASSGEALLFLNQNEEEIMKLDKEGNLILRGSVTEFRQSEQIVSDTIFNTFVPKVKQALAVLGFFVENGIAQVKELIADKITAKKVATEMIELRDIATGEIYCTWIENGEWVKRLGECSEGNYELGIMNYESGQISEELVTENSAESIFTTSTAPGTFIDSYPGEVTTSTEATFEFYATKDGVTLNEATFQCKVNLQNWTNCASPKTYPGLVSGDYTFQVFATDAQGNYDETPAVFSWTILGTEQTTTEQPPIEGRRDGFPALPGSHPGENQASTSTPSQGQGSGTPNNPSDSTPNSTTSSATGQTGQAGQAGQTGQAEPNVTSTDQTATSTDQTATTTTP